MKRVTTGWQIIQLSMTLLFCLQLNVSYILLLPFNVCFDPRNHFNSAFNIHSFFHWTNIGRYYIQETVCARDLLSRLINAHNTIFGNIHSSSELCFMCQFYLFNSISVILLTVLVECMQIHYSITSTDSGYMNAFACALCEYRSCSLVERIGKFDIRSSSCILSIDTLGL